MKWISKIGVIFLINAASPRGQRVKVEVVWLLSPSVSELILDLCPANERRRYFVTTALIGWVQAYNQPSVYPCQV